MFFFLPEISTFQSRHQKTSVHSKKDFGYLKTVGKYVLYFVSKNNIFVRHVYLEKFRYLNPISTIQNLKAEFLTLSDLYSTGQENLNCTENDLTVDKKKITHAVQRNFLVNSVNKMFPSFFTCFAESFTDKNTTRSRGCSWSNLEEYSVSQISLKW